MTDLAKKMMKYSSYSVDDVVGMAARIAALEKERDLAVKEMSKWAFKYGQLEAENAALQTVAESFAEKRNAIGNENAALKAELAELREAAAWYLECDDFWTYRVGVRLESIYIFDDCVTELTDTRSDAESALRALLAKEER